MQYEAVLSGLKVTPPKIYALWDERSLYCMAREYKTDDGMNSSEKTVFQLLDFFSPM